MINKNKFVIFAFILFIITTQYVKAELPVGLGMDNKDTKWGDGPDITYDDGNSRYVCKYKVAYGANVSVNISAIDMDGNEIIDNNGNVSEYTLSGTWVGLDVKEHSQASWNVKEVKRYKKKIKYTCKYTGGCKSWESVTTTTTKAGCDQKGGTWTPPEVVDKPNSGQAQFQSYEASYTKDQKSNAKQMAKVSLYGTCTYTGKCKEYNELTSTYTKEYNEEFKCPDKEGYTITQTQEDKEDEDNSDLSTCQTKIGDSVRKKALSLLNNTNNTVNYINTNDYKNFTIGTIPVNETAPICSGNYQKGNCQKDYDHRPSKVCIDIKTGLIYYGNDCKSKHLIIDDINARGRQYWHYFVPLNARSDSMFYVEISQKNSNKLNIGFCENAMEKYSNYYQLIKPLYATQYDGSYNQSGTNSRDYKLLTKEKGCRTSIKILFDLKQKFYNESGNDKDLNGYKFYFRQVDIAKPFNTAPNSSSLWYKWYQNNKTKANFNDTFKGVSYRAVIKNPQAIRDYADSFNDPYTSWKNISADGKSTFINTYVERRNVGKIYKLGCGPENKDWSGCK